MSFANFFRPAKSVAHPAIDPEGRIKSSYFICTSHRSGSTLLGEGIAMAGCGDANEYFEENMERIWKEKWQLPADADSASQLQKMVAHATTANGIFGVKIMWHQLETLGKKLRPVVAADEAELPNFELLNRAFGQPRFIWLQRADKVKQAISLIRAQQTGRWHSVDLTGWVADVPRVEVEQFDFAQIDEGVKLLKYWDKCWGKFFQSNGVTPLTIVYEEFATSYEETLRGALKFIGAKVKWSFKFPPPRLGKLADETSERWEAEYLARQKELAASAA